MADTAVLVSRLKAAFPEWAVYEFRAPQDAPAQYLIVQSAANDGALEDAMCGSAADESGDVRILARGQVGESVRIMLRRVKAELSPGGLPSALSPSVFVRWLRSEFVMADLDVVDAVTNRHPFYGIDTYSLMVEAV